MRKKVLFVAPQYMELYKDITAEMERQQYKVDFIAEQSYMDDPDNIRGYARFAKFLTNRKKFKQKIDRIWSQLLEKPEYGKNYDYCFVLDGQSISSVLFQVLRERNPNVKIINYLFDTTTGVYHFEKNFQYYDKVFSFDLNESKKYQINFLPIYWLPCDAQSCPKHDIFGFGAIKDERYRLFVKLEKLAKKKGLSCYLKLYNFVNIKIMLLYRLRYVAYRLINLKNIISPEALLSSFSTKQVFSPNEFRRYIAGANIVVDTASRYQDGLTARFMWSLGLGKKIITTNFNVEKYDFYDPKQIFVYHDSVDEKQLEKFLSSEYEINDAQKKKICLYRIDFWLKTLLG